MSKYPVKINGEDFTDLFHRRGYMTDRQPVYAGTYTDLDHIDHYVVKRWRGFFAGTTNDLTADDAARLCAALLTSPVQLTYHSFQLGKVVTETMALEEMPQALKLKTSRTPWVEGVQLAFRQL